MSLRRLPASWIGMFMASLLFGGCALSFAQNPDVNLSLHAKSQATAAEPQVVDGASLPTTFRAIKRAWTLSFSGCQVVERISLPW